MTIGPERFEGLARRASRELRVAVDAAGAVRWSDARAGELLGLQPGESLFDRVAPGSEGKLRGLLDATREGAVRDWELAFRVQDRAVSVAVSAEADGELVLLLGVLFPGAFDKAMGQIDQMISEVVDLNRIVSGHRDELARQNERLVRVNQELSESNRGVLALHTELEQSTLTSRQDAEIKSRVVANLSHELRTPLHSILGLTGLLTSEADGKLASEQLKQLGFIRASAEELLGLVNDMLDLEQIEAGHTRLRVDDFDLEDFVASLRGALRPLLPPARGDEVELVFEDPPPGIRLETDRTKLGQILRNLVSNAIKFTERGEIRVRFELAGRALRAHVSDTGIGIDPRDFSKIFEEYGQIDSAVQRRTRGTGLGLPIARRLAVALGGTLVVESEPGKGSTFTLELPLQHAEAELMDELVSRSRVKGADVPTILVVEDDRRSLFLYEKYLTMAGFHVMPARTIEDAQAAMTRYRPDAVVLDVMLEDESSWSFLARLKSDAETRDIPVLVVTITNREDKARALGADEFWLKPVDQDRLLQKLKELARTTAAVNVLVIDDDPTARYLIRRHLVDTHYRLHEASTGEEGLAIARRTHPKVILLDFLLEGCTAFDVLDELKADPATRGIPVIIVTSQVLAAVDQERLLQEAEAVISKQNLSRELAINRIRDALRKLEANRERRQ